MVFSFYFLKAAKDILQIVDFSFYNLTPQPVTIQNSENTENEIERYWILHSQPSYKINGIATLVYQPRLIDGAFNTKQLHFTKHVLVPSGVVKQTFYIENVR